MNKKYLISAIILIILVLGLFFYFNLPFENDRNNPNNYKFMDIKSGDKVSFENGILNWSEVPVCEGDFQITFYEREEFPGIATISTVWKRGHPRYSDFCPTTALTQKITEKSFEEITIQDCKNLNYERGGTIVEEGDVVCLQSEDMTYSIIKLTEYYGNYRGKIKYKTLN